jgi:hypothetical protein
VNKYGWEQFTFEVLEHFPSKQDLSREILINLMKKKEAEYILTIFKHYIIKLLLR